MWVLGKSLVFPKKFREDSVNKVLLHQPLYRLSPFHLQYSTTGTSLVQQKQWVQSEQLDWWRSLFLCVLFVYFFYYYFEEFFFFFWRGRERESGKKYFFNMYMYLLWCTPGSFTCKKIFPHIIANSFCYFRAGLWPELMSKVGTTWVLNNYKYDFCESTFEESCRAEIMCIVYHLRESSDWLINWRLNFARS